MVDYSYSRSSEGTGLGLAISSKLIEMMNGQIGFESEAGKGSTFWFELQLGKDIEGLSRKINIFEHEPLNKPLEDLGTNHRGKPIRILLAEDNSTNQLVTKTMLGKVGYRVDVVSNGLEAVKAVNDLPYDVILMDVSMPEMDGLQATQKIRSFKSRKANIPIIAMSAHAMPQEIEKFFSIGMSDFIAKPANKKDILTVLDRWVRARKWPDPTQPDMAYENEKVLT